MTRLVISQRDVDCFSFLHASKVATAKQVHREVFRNARSNFYKKIRQYEELKLVNRLTGAKDFDLSGVYELTKKGFNIVRANQKGLIVHQRYKSNSAFHDLFLVEIRHQLILRELVTRYFTENQIQTSADFDSHKELVDFKRFHCDALMTLKHATSGNEINLALEFELSDKSMRDYKNKLSDYYNSGSIPAVLYICHDKQTETRIKKSEQEVYQGSKNRIYYASFDQFKNPGQKVTFEALNGSIITL